MTVTLYADILFLVNFIMNGFVLWTLSKVMRARVKSRWLLCGSAVMALLYTVLIAVPGLRHVNVVLASVVILAAGVAAAFHPRGVGQFVKQMAVAYVISFTVGGLGMALFFLTDIPYALYFIAADSAGFMRTVSWQLALVGMAASYVLIKIGIRLYERHTLKRQMLCNVCVAVGESRCTFDALVDTGHNLREPLSQSPVIIAEFERVKPLLPDTIKVLFYEKKEDNLDVLLTMQEDTFKSRIRMIPFTSLGRANGMLIGFKPDNVKVEGAKEPISRAVIGIYNDRLCKSNRYGGLLSPELVA